MVNEASNTTFLCRINDSVLIDPEKVTAPNATFEVLALSHICDLLSHLLSNIFDDHVVGCDIFHGVETPIVNGRSGKFNGLLPFLELVESDGIAFTIRGC